MKERMAPGHVYQPRLGNGLQWQAGAVKLWEGGQVTAEAGHATRSAYDFWHGLAFAACFPAVTHWWFRSAWTQKVRLSPRQGVLRAGTAWGWMQFVDEYTPAQMYFITEAERPVIAAPYPPNEVQPANLPLRLALARLVSGVTSGEMEPDRWYIVTSLVRGEELEIVYPTSREASHWQVEGIDTSVRETFCRLQGLREGH